MDVDKGLVLDYFPRCNEPWSPDHLRLLWVIELYDMEGLANKTSQSIAFPVNNLES